MATRRSPFLVPALAVLAVVLLAYAPAAAAPGSPIEIDGPARLDVAGATYVLTRDIDAPGTAFTIAADDVTLDLGGHTVTYGSSPVVAIPNAGFEAGSGAIPAEWDLRRAPRSRRVAHTWYWGRWEMASTVRSGIPEILRSSSIELPAGQTFAAFAWVRGDDTIDAALRIRDAESGEVIAEDTSKAIHRGFAIVVPFRLPVARTVVAELVLSGSGSAWLDQVDIKPAFQYGVASSDWQSESFFPDLPPGSISHGANLRIINGTITQGSAQAVFSPAIKAKGPDLALQDLTLRTNSINSHVVDFLWGRNITVLDSRIESTSMAVFNRMVPQALLNLTRSKDNVLIRNCSLVGGAQQGINLFRNYAESSANSSIRIENNDIRHHEKVTNGYGISLVGCRNFTIQDNTIIPEYGRGILVDTAGADGTNRNGIIRRNTISVREHANHEFPATSLQVAGIRLRTYPPKGIFDLVIEDNQITAVTDSNLVSEANGIVVTLRSAEENAVIQRNSISVHAEGEGRSAYALLFEDTLALSHTVARENLLESNIAAVRFGDFDGGVTSGIQLVSNTFRRADTHADGFHSVLYGFSSESSTGNELLDSRGANGADPHDILFSGSGEKDLRLSWYLTVQVTDNRGRPFPFASVEIKDRFGTTVAAPADASGHLTVSLPEYVRSGPDGGTFKEFNPYLVRAFSGNHSSSLSTEIRSSGSVTLSLDTTAPTAGPPPVLGLGRLDVH